jgi:flavodoxin I
VDEHIQQSDRHWGIVAMTVELEHAMGLDEDELMQNRLIAPEQSNPRHKRYDISISRLIEGGHRNHLATDRAKATVPHWRCIMAPIGLFYGSDTGNTEDVVGRIKNILDEVEPGLVQVFDMSRTNPADFEPFQNLILGIPTTNIGQLPTDWDIFWPHLDEIDFSGKKVALFGLGDQYAYANTFMDALGMLAYKVQERGGELVGKWPADGYNFDSSVALDGDHFLGLALDQENQSELTQSRLNTWLPSVLAAFGLSAVASTA